MITLRPYQYDGFHEVCRLMRDQTTFVEGSTTGYGKTVVLALACQEAGLTPAVICPKSIIGGWERTFNEIGLQRHFVLNPEKVKLGYAFPYGRWKIKNKQWEWSFPEDTLLIFDEAHMYRTRKNQNTKLMTAVRRSFGLKGVAVSATLAESPLDMFAIGSFLGLHDGDDEFKAWCVQNGCRKGKWGMEYKKGIEGMAAIHSAIYPGKGHRADASKLDGFPMNQIDTLSIDSDDATKVQRQLDELAEKREFDVALPVVDLLRARQAVELLKTAALYEMAENDIRQGNNVVIFVNFIETLNVLQEYFGEGNCSVIHGSQSLRIRELNHNRFQNNEVNAIVCQIKSGGQSIDLHDLNGRPRVSYVCPSDSATATVQALGRICRSGSLSPAVQHMVFAHGTIEERVRQRVAAKIDNIDALNDGDMDMFDRGEVSCG